METILCCGEALIDMLPRQLPDRSPVLMPVAGGAVFNTALALGRLGEKCGFVSGISTDMFGEQLVAALKQSNVDCSLAIRSNRPTTLAFVELKDGHARYTFYDENSAGRMITGNDLPDIPAGTAAMHFGAISLIPDPCGAAYEALMQREAGKCVISLDPNIRANFITDAQAHRARIRRMIAMSDIVKVSDEDLAWIEPDANGDEAAIAWQREGRAIVIITRGANGATVHHHGGGVLAVPAVPAKVVDTVGAGDTFNAGLLAGLRREGMLSKSGLATIGGEALGRAVGLAVRVAGITVSRAGANPPWQNELG